MRGKRRRTAALLLAALLAAGTAGAAPRRPAQPAGWDVWKPIREAWTAIWQKAGCEADPYGRCIPAPTPPEADQSNQPRPESPLERLVG